MASIHHICSMRPIIQNQYPNPFKILLPPSTNHNFLQHKPEHDFTMFKTLPVFKNRPAILPFTAKNLLAKAQRNSQSNKEIILDRKNMGSGILFYLAERAKIYITLMRLVHMGSWFFAVPIWWAIGLAADPANFPDAKMLALFAVFGVSTQGIACTINDYLDRDVDAKVERTKSRPLVTGEVSPFEAICLLGFQLLLGYGLLCPVNDLSRILWISSMLLQFSYPLTKRVTYWAQAYLGLTVNFSVLYAWSAVKGSLDGGHILIPLYISGACFTIVYDTIYAHQDKKDGEKIGLKSTAILFGNLTKEWTTAITAACVAGFTLTGVLANIGWPYYAFLAAASAQFAWQIWTVDLSSPSDCGKTFQTSAIFAALIFFGILFGRLYQ